MEKVTKLSRPGDPEDLMNGALEQFKKRKIVAAHVALLDENGVMWKDGCGFTRESLLYALEIVKLQTMNDALEQEW